MKDLAITLIVILGFAAYIYGVERRYQPDTAAEYVVGYFLLPGDLVTSRDHSPQKFIEFTAERFSN